MKTTFYFIRHGESLANEQHRLCGHADWDLTEKGREAGGKIAEKINSVLDGISDVLTEEERIVFYHSLAMISDRLETVSKNGLNGRD